MWNKALFMFAAFSMTASGCYLINDIVDLESDRRHHTKRLRPLAAGNLRISEAIILATLLLLGGFGAAFAVGLNAVAILLLYFVLTTCYSLSLKSMLVVDVIVLAMLYILRIVAGHAATGIPESFWLYTFSGTIFLSLAFLKRYVEINRVAASGEIHGADNPKRQPDRCPSRRGERHHVGPGARPVHSLARGACSLSGTKDSLVCLAHRARMGCAYLDQSRQGSGS